MSAKDMRGMTFGRLKVVERSGSTRGGAAVWACVCECGNRADVAGIDLRRGDTRSCGCLVRDINRDLFTRHGHARDGKRSSEYIVWRNILARCLNPETRSFAGYGGRGIRVCDAWRDSFEQFLRDVGPRPTDKHSLDRIKNDGHYEPGNVRWATATEQARNRKNNVEIALFGQKKLLVEWAEQLGIPAKLIRNRIARGWSAERALLTPDEASRGFPERPEGHQWVWPTRKLPGRPF